MQNLSPPIICNDLAVYDSGYLAPTFPVDGATMRAAVLTDHRLSTHAITAENSCLRKF